MVADCVVPGASASVFVKRVGFASRRKSASTMRSIVVEANQDWAAVDSPLVAGSERRALEGW